MRARAFRDPPVVIQKALLRARPEVLFLLISRAHNLESFHSLRLLYVIRYLLSIILSRDLRFPRSKSGGTFSFAAVSSLYLNR